MKTSKKIFIVCIVIFLAAVAYVAYDISTKTVAPWSKEKNNTVIDSSKVEKQDKDKDGQ